MNAGGGAAARGGQPAGRHRRDDPALRVSEKADLCDVGQRFCVFPDGQRIGNLLFDGHILHPALALPVSVEIEQDGGDAGPGERLREGGHRVEVLAGEDSVHQEDHRALVRFGVEALRQGDLHREPAFGTGNRIFTSLGGEKAQKQDNCKKDNSFHSANLQNCKKSVQNTPFYTYISQNQKNKGKKAIFALG